MAHKVYISSDISLDEPLNELGEQNPLYTLIWPWLLTAFDDWGRADASPRRLKAQLFPLLDAITVNVIRDAILAYDQVGLLMHYEVEGKWFIAIPREKWFRYQTHIHKDKRDNDEQSRIPAPPSDTSAHLRASPRDIAEPRASSAENCASPSPSPSPSLSLSPSARARARGASALPNERESSAKPFDGDDGVTVDIEQKRRKTQIRAVIVEFWGQPDEAARDKWRAGIEQLSHTTHTIPDIRRAIELFPQRRPRAAQNPSVLAREIQAILNEARASPTPSPNSNSYVQVPNLKPTEDEYADSDAQIARALGETSAG